MLSDIIQSFFFALSNIIQAIYMGLLNGEGWAVGAIFIIGIVAVGFVNFIIERIRRVQQWFAPIQVPAPPPTRPSPSGFERFMTCFSAGLALLVIFGGLALLILRFFGVI